MFGASAMKIEIDCWECSVGNWDKIHCPAIELLQDEGLDRSSEVGGGGYEDKDPRRSCFQLEIENEIACKTVC